jgi:hypothetical protein
MTVTHQYLLRRASDVPATNARTKQIAKGNKMSGLLNIRHSIVGQQAACNRAFDLIFAHVALKRPEPLLLAFSGPAGHGKTELAERLEDMFSAESTTVNCAGVRTVFGLFGAEAGHGGHDTGTTLNNFLVENDSRRSLVFLDEFDKTEQAVIDALLRICEKGESLSAHTELLASLTILTRHAYRFAWCETPSTVQVPSGLSPLTSEMTGSSSITTHTSDPATPTPGTWTSPGCPSNSNKTSSGTSM